jgi:hypothetical protein
MSFDLWKGEFMYTCRSCNTEVDDSDRYCFRCGAYIGEPAKQKDYWNNDESNEELVFNCSEEVGLDVEDNNEFAGGVKQIALGFRQVIKTPISAISQEAESRSYKGLITFCIFIFLGTPLMLGLLVNYVLPIPNDLIDILLPTKLTNINLKDIINLPRDFYLNFAYFFIGIVLTLSTIYLIIYFLSRILFNSWKSPIKLFKTLLVAYFPYAVTLTFYFIISFVGYTAANIFMLFGTVYWIISAYQSYYIFSDENADKAFLLTGCMFSAYYVIFYMYLYSFLR